MVAALIPLLIVFLNLGWYRQRIAQFCRADVTIQHLLHRPGQELD